MRKKWQAARCYLATGWELKSVTGRRIDEIEALSLYWPRRRKQIRDSTNKEENQSTNKQPTQSDTHASAAATYINVRIRQTVDKRHLFALLYSTYLRNKKRPRHLFSVKCLPKKEKSIQSFCQSHFSYCQRKTQRGERITKKAISIKLSNYLCATHTS